MITALDEIEEKGIQGIIVKRKQAVVRQGTELAYDVEENLGQITVEPLCVSFSTSSQMLRSPNFH